VDTGQLITSLASLKDQTGISIRSIRTCLSRLKSTQELTIKTTSRYTLITICNYSTYQTREPANDTPPDTPATSHRQTNDNKQEGKELKNEKKKETYSVEFLSFWTAYPRKIGKLNAWKSWIKLKPPLKETLDVVERYKQSEGWKKEEGRYIPHPATFLNGGRWEDEPGEAELTDDEKVARYDAKMAAIAARRQA